jgi:uncharacterized membrane protein YfcA
MTDTTDPPGNEDPDFTPAVARVRSRSDLTAGTFGCMAGGGIGVAGAVLFAALLLAGSNATGAALLSVAAALAGGVLVFRRFQREDPPVAVGLLIGLAIVGLLAGMCTAQLG